MLQAFSHRDAGHKEDMSVLACRFETEARYIRLIGSKRKSFGSVYKGGCENDGLSLTSSNASSHRWAWKSGALSPEELPSARRGI